MKRVVLQCLAVAVLLSIAVGISSELQGQRPAADEPAQSLPLRPRQPSGMLAEVLGTFVTIEGHLFDGNAKVESNSLLVDTVNGSRLDQPFAMLVKNVRLPAQTRCVLKGYELGEMIGRPPAEYELTKELDRDPNELASRDATAWRWRPYFVPLLAAEPQGLKVSTKWGLDSR